MARVEPEPVLFESFPRGERLLPVRREENGREVLLCGRKHCRGYAKARLQKILASFNQYQCPECLGLYNVPFLFKINA